MAVQVDRPIELEDLDTLKAELQELRKECSQLDCELRSTKRSLSAAKVRQEELQQKVDLREAENTEISQKLGSAEKDFTDLQHWRQKTKEQAQKAKELQEGIETERQNSDARIAELRQMVQRQGRPNSAKADEAEETRRRRIALDDTCGRLQILRDYILGSLPDMEPKELELLLQDEEEHPKEDDSNIDTEIADQVMKDLQQEHDNAIKELVESVNSLIDKKNNTWKKINKGILPLCLLRLERCAPQDHTTIREVLDAAAALCRVRVQQGDETLWKARVPEADGKLDTAEGEPS
ncbi:unnamed protein product [Durusdinium trenchii]|uniref:Uncharacterized protein n=2 Tax=Durusdinium trenchii TaxID=1381693 RepID=A0ABP0QL09_9DINO